MGRGSWACPGGGSYGQGELGMYRETFGDCNSDLALLFLAHSKYCIEKVSDRIGGDEAAHDDQSWGRVWTGPGRQINYF